MERVVGIGSVFLKARDPKALAAWYRDHLGVPVDPGQTYGALTSSGQGEMTVWSTFPAATPYFGPGPATFMVNYRVKDLEAMLAQLRAAGAQVEDKVEAHEYGRFGWATDPEGNRFELWEPKQAQRALVQFFKPENHFAVREGLLQTGRADRIGGGCDCLLPLTRR